MGSSRSNPPRETRTRTRYSLWIGEQKMKTAAAVIAAFVVGLFVAATSAQLAARLEQSRVVASLDKPEQTD